MRIRLLVSSIALCFANLSCLPQDYSIKVDNIDRIYRIKLPENYTESVKYPVVFVLHGYHTEVLSLRKYTGFDDKAEKAGFIAVYPQGTINENGYYLWNAGGIFEDWTHGVNDVKFIDKLIDYMIENYSVDKNRIYVTGHSNGSMMAYRLAAELSGKIAAVACVEGQMLSFSGVPSSPVAVMHIHGDADLIVPHTGTRQEGFQVPAVDEVLKKWINWNSCSTVPSVLKYDSLVTALQWKGKADVRFYLIHGLGHDWPTTERGGWPATDYIWEFFKTIKKE